MRDITPGALGERTGCVGRCRVKSSFVLAAKSRSVGAERDLPRRRAKTHNHVRPASFASLTTAASLSSFMNAIIRRPYLPGRSIAKTAFLITRDYSVPLNAKTHNPLNILFCGADEFSIYSLRALHSLQRSCPDKRTQHVPIKPIATELGLRLHQIDSFKDWQAPPDINLVVAVSFGLLVPSALLKAAKYGGLNVHPSLLPQFRGPAPIQHALLQRCTQTGVTLQTMHPTRFDHGVVLDQRVAQVRDAKGLRQMIELLGPIGADLLVDGIINGSFVPPSTEPPELSAITASYAPKLTPQDRQIDWIAWTADDIVLRNDVLGDLWDDVTYTQCHQLGPAQVPIKRLKFKGPWKVAPGRAETCLTYKQSPGSPVIMEGPDPKIGLTTRDNKLVSPREIVIEGGKGSDGHRRLVQALTAGKT
ncbi:Methionyl-tRNA formyltransferase [Teratosphaeriaceae sp. CCFEE 6253]|nr:Methionyl-tRNA formyltransferase [Teratosphaeriaceae sp. CCFEE 6253]